MAIEDYTTYTEVDPNSHIGLVGTNHIDFNAYANEDAYCYKDKGAAHFTDFEHKVDVRPISASADYCYGCNWLLSNALDDYHGLRTAGQTCVVVRTGHWTVAYPQLYLSEYYGSTEYNAGPFNAAYNTWYYLTIKKLGTALTCKIYSDSARTTLLNTLSLTLQADHSFRYIFAANTQNEAVARNFDLDIENLDLQEAPAVGPSRAYIIG